MSGDISQPVRSYCVLGTATTFCITCFHRHGDMCCSVVEENLGRIFVTRTSPYVRFIVYRSNKNLQTLVVYITIINIWRDSWASFPLTILTYRLIRATACRLVQEEDTVQLYYSTENTREFKEVEEQSLEVGEVPSPCWRNVMIHTCSEYWGYTHGIVHLILVKSCRKYHIAFCHCCSFKVTLISRWVLNWRLL